ncbi:MAG: IS3 family transposase [bacterium]
MKSRFIFAQKAIHRLDVLCRVMRVNRSTYYARVAGWDVPKSKDDALAREIHRVHANSKGRYGVRRVWHELRHTGVGRHRITRLMRELELRGRGRRRFRVTTQASDRHKPAPNVLKREFCSPQPNRTWVSDITYVPTRQGWLYVCIVIDLFSRRVVGWSSSSRMAQTLTLQALKMAVVRRQPQAGWLHHSDRGSQYTAAGFVALVQAHGGHLSMSRKGDCWDNAVAESFFATLKKEAFNEEDFSTREQAHVAMLEFVRWYNAERRHSTLG